MGVNYRSKIVAAELKFVDVTGGSSTGDDVFIKYYNKLTGTSFSVSTTPWCAIFQTYNMRTNNIPTSVCPNFAGCTSFRNNFMIPKGIWKLRTSGYIPTAGDLIFFNWNKVTTTLQHVGMVEKVVGSTVYTIEGNSKGGYAKYGVRHKSYPITSPYIVGYGALKYESISNNSSSTTTTTNNTSTTKSSYLSYIKSFQTWMNTNYKTGLAVDGKCGALTRAATVKVLQTILKNTYKKNLAIDSKFGSITKSLIPTLSSGSSGPLVYLVQGMIYCNGISAGGFDGKFGPLMCTALRTVQTSFGLTCTGTITGNTVYRLYQSM